MKKYLLGFTAIVLAIGFSAFTNSKTTTFDHIFAKVTTNVTQPVVENVALYYDSGTPAFICDAAATVPCDISALTKYAHQDEDLIWVLNTQFVPGCNAPYLTITANTVVSGKYYIASIVASDNGIKGTDFDFRNASYQ